MVWGLAQHYGRALLEEQWHTLTYTMDSSYTTGELAQRVEGKLRGAADVVISGVAEVSEASPGQATWVSNPKYAKLLADSRAGVVLVSAGFGPTPMPAILCPQVERSVALLLEAFAPEVPRPPVGIHPSAVVDPQARLGANHAIGPGVVIEANVELGANCALHAGVYIGQGTVLGDDCVIWPNAVIRDGCRLGDRVMVHSNAVIGADGLGFYFHEGRHRKIPHTGGVILALTLKWELAPASTAPSSATRSSGRAPRLIIWCNSPIMFGWGGTAFLLPRAAWRGVRASVITAS